MDWLVLALLNTSATARVISFGLVLALLTPQQQPVSRAHLGGGGSVGR